MFSIQVKLWTILHIPHVFVSSPLSSIHTIQSDSIFRFTLIARLLLHPRHWKLFITTTTTTLAFSSYRRYFQHRTAPVVPTLLPPPADWQWETTTHTGGRHFRWPIRVWLGGTELQEQFGPFLVILLISHGYIRGEVKRDTEHSAITSLHMNGLRTDEE